jgi:hypothetical protein
MYVILTIECFLGLLIGLALSAWSAERAQLLRQSLGCVSATE